MSIEVLKPGTHSLAFDELRVVVRSANLERVSSWDD